MSKAPGVKVRLAVPYGDAKPGDVIEVYPDRARQFIFDGRAKAVTEDDDDAGVAGGDAPTPDGSTAPRPTPAVAPRPAPPAPPAPAGGTGD